MVERALGPPQLLFAINRRFYPQFRTVRDGYQSRSAHLFRVLQGLAGGGLQPTSQSVLLDAFPREKQGVAMTLFGLAALLAPVFGSTLGGWLTDEYQWRWVFLINVPIGLAAFAGCYFLLRDPDYLTKERSELKKRPFHFDSIGLLLLVAVMVSWEVMLSKGQEWDWLGDPFWRVQALAILFTVGLAGLIYWELRSPNPVVNFRPLAERTLASAVSLSFAPMPCSSVPALLCQPCFNRYLVTTPWTRGW